MDVGNYAYIYIIMCNVWMLDNYAYIYNNYAKCKDVDN